MRLLTSALVAGFMAAGAANAAEVTFTFSGPSNLFNAGLPGNGPISGSITYDTDQANFINGSLFNGAFSDININVNGVAVTADGSCTAVTCSTFNQVVIGGPQDSFLSTYSGPFGPTGQSYGIESVSFEIRTDFQSLFTDTTMAFNALSDGDSFDISGDYVSLVIAYDDQSVLTNSIMRSNDLTSMTVSVTGDTISDVPLPAGLPLMLAGLGAFAMTKRRKG